MGRPLVSFTESELRAAVAASLSYSDALRRLGMRAAGGNHRTLRKYVGLWAISVAHFDRHAWQRTAPRRGIPLDEILVERSTYVNRTKLKKQLYEKGLKTPHCELCGQGAVWRGRRMSLILDHVNGIHDDNRLDNLRIVCPNCNATLETHCGRNLRRPRPERACERCGSPFVAEYERQRHCSRECGWRWDRRGRPLPGARRAERPPYDVLCAEIAAKGYEAVGREHGVSGNAVRKWRRGYEAERQQAA